MRTIRRVCLIGPVALIGLGAALAGWFVPRGNPVTSHPAPVLFSATQIGSLSRELAEQKPRADRAFALWSAGHSGRDDGRFTAFALSQLSAPPDARVQTRELAELRQLADSRTAQGMAAARWLEVYGKKDVWLLYLRDASELLDSRARGRAEALFSADTDLAKTLAAAAKVEFGRHAPSVLDPTLRRRPVAKDRLSYPSTHAVYVFSELAVLRELDHDRSAEFERMADEVAFSRLYAAGHYRSDLVEGAFLGDLIADYELSLQPRT